MNKKGKRLREFEKNNREFSMRTDEEKKDRRAKKDSEEERTSEFKDQRKKKKRMVLNIKRLVMSAMICLFVVSVGVSGIKIISLQSEYKALEERKEELEQLKEKLTAELEYVDSDEYIEQQARKSLRLVMDNEILFILPDGKDTKKDESTNGQAQN